MKKKHAAKVSLNRQTKEIVKLLLVWPDCPAKYVAQFIQQTLNTTPTRVCIQEAKAGLGLAEPKHLDSTKKKRAWVHSLTLTLVDAHGLGGMTEKKLVSLVEKELKGAFKERTNHRLVTAWVTGTLNELAGIDITEYPKLIAEAVAEAEALGVEPEGNKKQIDLLSEVGDVEEVPLDSGRLLQAEPAELSWDDGEDDEEFDFEGFGEDEDE